MMHWKFYWYTTVLLLFPLCSTSQQRGPETRAGVVCWQEGRKLTWQDFQATVEPTLTKSETIPGLSLGATTEAKAIVYDYSQMRAEVSVQFDKRKSWINQAFYFDRKVILVHEQLHFDVVELTGRKIRQVLARCRAQGIKDWTPEIDAEIGCLYDEESDLQMLYDKEDGTGHDAKALLRWQLLIAKELARLSAYKSTAADCIIP